MQEIPTTRKSIKILAENEWEVRCAWVQHSVLKEPLEGIAVGVTNYLV